MIGYYTKEQWNTQWTLPFEKWEELLRLAKYCPLGKIRKVEVSSFGRVRKSYRKPNGTKVREILNQRSTDRGYLIVTIDKVRYKVHRLVLEGFNPIKNQEVFDADHINGDKADNRIINLRWCTRKENNNNPITLQRRIASCGKKVQAIRERDGLIMWEWPTIRAAAKRFDMNPDKMKGIFGDRTFCDTHTYPGCYLRLAP